MAALRDYPSLAPDRDPAVVRVNRGSRIRPIVAVLLLTAIGLLVAASVLASRPYQPAPHSRTVPPRATAPDAPGPDPC